MIDQLHLTKIVIIKSLCGDMVAYQMQMRNWDKLAISKNQVQLLKTICQYTNSAGSCSKGESSYH